MTLDEMLQPGRAVRIDYGPNNPGNGTEHIRAIVDEKQIVYCRWLRRKGRYSYGIYDRYWYELLFQDGHLKNAGLSNFEEDEE